VSPPNLATTPVRGALDPATVAVIAVGGGLGSLARYGLTRLWPAAVGDLDWTILLINVAGSFLLGMLVVAVTELWQPHRLVRPLLGTGVLGGFTTFSTFAVQVRADAAGTALAQVALSVAGGVAAAGLGMLVMRALGPRRPDPAGTGPLDPDLP
jgi:CrcB protein